MSSERRRLMGQSRVPGALGLTAAVALLTAGCDDSPDYDYARFCATKAPTVQRVDDRYCEGDDGDRPTSAYGWYYQQFPPRSSEYDEDNETYVDTTPDLFIVSTGGYPSGGTFARPRGVAPGKVLTAPPAVAGQSGTPMARSGVVRGGFGVPGRGSSGA